MPGDGLTPRGAAIVAAAGELLDEEGRDALTMRRLAERTGLKASSLYRHLPGKGAIEAALIGQALEDAADAFEAATAARPSDPLAAIGRAYRAFALAWPHRYRLMTELPLPETSAVAAANRRAAAPLVAALGGDEHRARARGRSRTAWRTWSSRAASRRGRTSTPRGRRGWPRSAGGTMRAAERDA